MTRVAEPETEQTLLDLALAGTTSHVERAVRAARQQGADPVLASSRRTLAWHWDDDGTLVLRGRFAPAEGAALVAAIESLTGTGPARPTSTSINAGTGTAPPGEPPTNPDEPGDDVVDPAGARRADALSRLAADEAGLGGPPPGGSRSTRPRQRARVVVHIDGSTGAAEIDGGPGLPAASAERLACDADVQLLLRDRKARLYLGRTHRLATNAQLVALIMRDSARCQFPGCTHTRHLHAHHVRHWLHGGRTDIDKQTVS